MSDLEPEDESSSVSPALETKPWAPLTISLYRSFWIAGLFSNLGTWMHETGSQWLMKELDGTPGMVSAVRTAMTVPVFLLALPAGVWADHFDRRKWLIFTQSLLLFFAAIMALLDWMNWMNPVVLLSLTFCLGIGSILNQPAWQALTPELVPPALVPSAVAVGSVSFNLARSLGPALAGLLIASIGTWITFLFNACSFLGVIAMLLCWHPRRDPDGLQVRQSFASELRNGLNWIAQSEMFRSVLLRVFLYAFPASCLWSLLSLVASDKLNLGAQGFGMLLGAIGGGAVLGVTVLPKLRIRYSNAVIVLWSEMLFAGLCLLVAGIESAWAAFVVMLVVGAAWMSTMTTFNATAQVHLPRRFRARGMAAYLMAFSSGMATGSAVWGQMAEVIGLNGTFSVAALTMIVASIYSFRMPLGEFYSAPAKTTDQFDHATTK